MGPILLVVENWTPEETQDLPALAAMLLVFAGVSRDNVAKFAAHLEGSDLEELAAQLEEIMEA